jgi:serine/threonine protein kinase
MNVEVIRELGNGAEGTVYLVKSGKKTYAYKLEKYRQIKDETKDTYYRQVEFDKFAKLHPDQFMTLKSHGIIEGCDLEQPIPKWAKGERKKELEAKNTLTACSYLMYQPVYKCMLHDVAKKIFKSKKRYLSMLLQLFTQVGLMHQAGFIHGDIHDANIMVDGKGAFHIIDYGAVYKDGWSMTKGDRWNKKNYHDGHKDVMDILFNVCIENPARDIARKNDFDFPSYKTLVRRIKKTPEYQNVIKYIPISVSIVYEHDDLAVFLMIVLHYDAYKKCMGFEGIDAMFTTKFPKLLLYIAAHMEDIDMIVRKIKKEITGLSVASVRRPL